MAENCEHLSPVVSLVETGAGVGNAVAHAMEAAGWRAAIPRGADVAIKPNLGWNMLLPGAITSPLVVEGVIRVLQGWAGKLHLVEADQVVVRCEDALRKTGLDRICARYGVEWINLSRTPFARVAVPDPLVVTELEIPEVLTRTVLVSVPVMKTHNKTVLTGAIKNQWGCLPKFRHNYHPVVDEVLCDLARVVRPAFTVLDGTVALEGNGPKSGRPRVCNLILAGRDPVAVDAVSARIMKLERFPIRHLELAAQAGVGVADVAHIRIVDGEGELRTRIPQFDFVPARHNTVSWLETALRSSVARRLVFESPLLVPMCWGARFWYFLWYYLFVGRRLRAQVERADPAATAWLRAGKRP